MNYPEHAANNLAKTAPTPPPVRRQDKPDSVKIERKLKADVEAWLKERRGARPPFSGR